MMMWIRRATLLLLIALGAAPAYAQTTTWSTTDKSADITLSGSNLIAAASATNAYKTVRGTVGKFSGKWCYQFTVGAVPSAGFGVGIANAEYQLTPTVVIGKGGYTAEGVTSIGLGTDGGVNWQGQNIASTADVPVNGQTGAVCINLDHAPFLLWTTPNVSGTSGAGGGPKWNGSVTQTPVGNVGGVSFRLPFAGVEAQANGGGCCYFPAFVGYNADQVTGNFGSFTPPTGYLTWSTSGGASPVPGPMSPQTINVANAPEWQSTHVYHTGAVPAIVTTPVATPGVVHWTGHGMTAGQVVTFSEQSGIAATFPTGILKNTPYYIISAGLAADTFEIATTAGGSAIAFTGSSSGTQLGFGLRDRFVAGAGWNGTAYTSGNKLCLFAVTSGGTTASTASAYNSACASGTPANAGGGLYGAAPAGWSGATTVTDGGVTSVLLTNVDYVTMTGAGIDDSLLWTPSTPYDKYRVVNTSTGDAWSNYNNDVFTNPVCTSGVTGPAFSGDGTCNWRFIGNVTYSSQNNRWPHMQMWGDSVGYYTMAYASDVYINVWYGGGQRMNYQPGQNGEHVPLLTMTHTTLPFDSTAFECWVGNTASPTVSTASLFILYTGGGGDGVDEGLCNGAYKMRPFRINFTVAAGDSFQDNIRPGIDPLRYDESKGVSFYTNLPVVNDIFSGSGAPWTLIEGFNLWERFNLKSEVGPIGGPSNSSAMQNDIIDGNWNLIMESFVSGFVRDSLIISRSTESGSVGMWSKYRVGLYNSTIVGTGTANTAASAVTAGYGFGAANGSPITFELWTNAHGGPPFHNNLIIGFQNDLVLEDPPLFGITWTSGMDSGNNATDIVSPSTIHTFSASADFPFGGSSITWKTLGWGGYSSTCGIANSSPCTGLTAANQLVNPTPGPDFDATLKPTADVKGAGASFSSNYGGYITARPAYYGIAGTDYPNITVPPRDILKTLIPQ